MRDVSPTQDNPQINEALAALQSRNAARFVEVMSRHRISPDARDRADSPLLCIAAATGQAEAVRWLIHAGADVNAPNREHKSAARLAAQLESPEVLGLLLSAGADPDLHGSAAPEDTALKTAVSTSWTREGNKVEMLLNAGATAQSAGQKSCPALVECNLYQNHVSAEVLREHLARPVLPAGPLGALTRKQLLASDANGRCLLDTPATWHRWEEVCAALQRHDKPFSKAELLAPRPDGDGSWLERGIACYRGAEVIAQLNKQGEVIGTQDLLDADSRPTPLFAKLLTHNALGAVASAANWQDGPAAFRTLYRSLDSGAQQQVPNFHGLLSRIALTSNVLHGRGR
jgi:hypothetical protein